jgi:hypothetical protein
MANSSASAKAAKAKALKTGSATCTCGSAGAPSTSLELAADVGEHVATFVADRSQDARRLDELDKLHALHERLEHDSVLAKLLSLCREEARQGHDGLAVFADRLGMEAAAVLSCISPLQTMGFAVMSLQDGEPVIDGDEDGASMTISIGFPWVEPPPGLSDTDNFHSAVPNAPWRLFITEPPASRNPGIDAIYARAASARLGGEEWNEWASTALATPEAALLRSLCGQVESSAAVPVALGQEELDRRVLERMASECAACGRSYVPHREHVGFVEGQPTCVACFVNVHLATGVTLPFNYHGSL